MTTRLEAGLARHRAVTSIALVVLTALAWLWLWLGAGIGMDPLVSLAPAAADPGQVMTTDMARVSHASPAGRVALTFAMWWIMMVAMMLPSAAPAILLYARAAAGPRTPRPPTASFLVGYLAVWGLFALAAALLQDLLERSGVLAPMAMALRSPWLSAAVLAAAGLYQLSPLKDACLRRCRHPAQVLSWYFRPGRAGALRMGAIHGAFCLGCCWLLMVLLFVGGVMNLAWIALLTVVLAAEKLWRHGRWVKLASGFGLIVWSLAVVMRTAGVA